MSRKLWHVTFAIKEADDPRHNGPYKVVVTEHLRYAGITGIKDSYHSTINLPLIVEKYFEDYTTGYVLVDIECPHGLIGETWAKMTRDRIRSFGTRAAEWSETK